MRFTEERRANLTDDEADDLVEGFALEASDAGREVLECMAPERRLRDLFDKAPGRLSTYLDIIDFCGEPQTFKAIEALVHQTMLGLYRRVGPAAAAELFRGHAGTLRRPGMG